MGPLFSRILIFSVGIAAFAAMPTRSEAQTSSITPAKSDAVQRAGQPPLVAPQAVVDVRPPMPAPEQLLGLIRSTVIALNQANQTGNYTVLRDLGAPDFRNGNDASRLGAIFQVLKEQAVDLGPLLHISPEVSQAPAIDANGLLRLVGFFPTEPLRVNFDLSFQLFENRWRPYTISVYLARLEARVETPELKPAASSAKK